MEPLFTNKCIYTKSNLNEVRKSTSSRKLSLILIICSGLVFILCGLITINYIYILLGAFFGIFYPALYLWAVRHSAANKYQQLQQLYHCEVESITSFYEDRLEVHNIQDGSNVTVAYPQVAKVFESKNLFFLMLSTRIGFMLDKQGFVGTTADEFGSFIRERAVGEGQIELKKRKRKSTIITTIVTLVIVSIAFAFGFFGIL